MPIDKDIVRHIAQLAKIAVSEDDIAQLSIELDMFLNFGEKLKEVDTEGIMPMTSVIEMKTKYRDDIIDDGGCVNQIILNAPNKEDGYFVVPKVVE